MGSCKRELPSSCSRVARSFPLAHLSRPYKKNPQNVSLWRNVVACSKSDPKTQASKPCRKAQGRPTTAQPVRPWIDAFKCAGILLGRGTRALMFGVLTMTAMSDCWGFGRSDMCCKIVRLLWGSSLYGQASNTMNSSCLCEGSQANAKHCTFVGLS